MNNLYRIIIPDVPVYFAVNGHRYKLSAYYFDEDGRSDPYADPNHYELLDIETLEYVLYTGPYAPKCMEEYPLAGGATIKNDLHTFDYLVYEGDMQNKVTLRVIVGTRFALGFIDRFHEICARLGMRILMEKCQECWKQANMSELSFLTDLAPEQSIEAWKAVFEELFLHTDYRVEPDTESSVRASCICRYTTPEENKHPDVEAYFAIMRIEGHL